MYFRDATALVGALHRAQTGPWPAFPKLQTAPAPPSETLDGQGNTHSTTFLTIDLENYVPLLLGSTTAHPALQTRASTYLMCGPPQIMVAEPRQPQQLDIRLGELNCSQNLG